MVLAWQNFLQKCPGRYNLESGQLINKPEKKKRKQKIGEEQRVEPGRENVCLHGYGENRGCDAKVLVAASRVR